MHRTWLGILTAITIAQTDLPTTTPPAPHAHAPTAAHPHAPTAAHPHAPTAAHPATATHPDPATHPATPTPPAAAPPTPTPTPPPTPTPTPPPAPPTLTLTTAGDLERKTLDKLVSAPGWPRRAVAASRLGRYGCAESRALVLELLDDRAWQVRNFALLSTRIRGEPLPDGWIERETNGRVLRTAIRFGAAPPAERLGKGIDNLAGSARRDDQLLAVELIAASEDESRLDRARTLTKKIILRMTRAQCGLFAPRLGMLTGATHLRRPHEWRQWLLKEGRALTLRSCAIPTDERLLPGRIADLEPERFAALEVYMATLAQRSVDLALCFDCTASMSGELAAAQAGMDDLILFVGDVVRTLRIGLVAYRDRQDDFRSHGWDLTEDRDAVRGRLWQLQADGGGDTREAVLAGLELAVTKLSWNPEHTMVLVLIGDAPPHVGRGKQCIDLARRAEEGGLIVHAIQAKGRPVEHFPEIADAGGGRCIDLADDDRLVPEIAGFVLGEVFEDEFREFFRQYLLMCR